ncbi:hypothetical protein ANO14919_047130 [Xylariales sp. No.14919]|nr:hypothetical protein ANO14919_047130 [Xylariales sp. No.14919]
MRSLSRMWKWEVERTFRRRFLPNINIAVALAAFPPRPKNRVVFEYDAEKSTAERAVLKLCEGTTLDRRDWLAVTYNLERGYTELREYFVHMITMSDLSVINNTELVGLQIDPGTQTLSFEWMPTMNQLFKEERKIRELVRADSEAFFNKGLAFYLMNKNVIYLIDILYKVRRLRSGIKSDVVPSLFNSTSFPYIHLPKERADLKLPKDCLSW